jgi:hypothetical protein
MAITPMTQFIHGVQLNETFYREAVAPILSAAFPELRSYRQKWMTGAGLNRQSAEARLGIEYSHG